MGDDEGMERKLMTSKDFWLIISTTRRRKWSKLQKYRVWKIKTAKRINNSQRNIGTAEIYVLLQSIENVDTEADRPNADFDRS